MRPRNLGLNVKALRLNEFNIRENALCGNLPNAKPNEGFLIMTLFKKNKKCQNFIKCFLRVFKRFEKSQKKTGKRKLLVPYNRKNFTKNNFFI